MLPEGSEADYNSHIPMGGQAPDSPAQRRTSRRGFFREALAGILAPLVELLEDTLLLVERYVSDILAVRARPVQAVLMDGKKSSEEKRILVRLKVLNFWWPKPVSYTHLTLPTKA